MGIRSNGKIGILLGEMRALARSVHPSLEFGPHHVHCVTEPMGCRNLAEAE